MYYDSFGISKNPFGMTPDPAFLYLTPQHREALAGLTYAILGQKGFLVLTGDAGTGKTTLLVRVLQHLPPARIHSSVIFTPTLTESEFLEMALLDFGVKDVPASKAQRLVRLKELLIEADRQNKISALIIDEAHRLSPEVLEEIRLLGNFEESDHKLLQILFIGQNELDEMLNRPDLRQLKQRVAARFTIGALAELEVAQYIDHRWKKAGGTDPAPFTSEAITAISRHSHGIPRVINAICDNALIIAFGESKSKVQLAHVTEACADLDLVRQPVQPEPIRKPTPELESEIPVLRTLERYNTKVEKRSFISRWTTRTRLAQ